MLADGDRAQVIVVPDAGKHKIGFASGLFRRWSHLAPEFGDPGLRLAERAIVDGDIVSAFRADVPGHGIAHDAQSNKCNLAHRASPRFLDLD